jgi:hypothetical protein
MLVIRVQLWPGGGDVSNGLEAARFLHPNSVHARQAANRT